MNVERETVAVGSFDFEYGGSIPTLEMAYEAYGEFTGDNAVLACHALTTSQRVADPQTDDTPPVADEATEATPWWDDLVGPGCAIDTDTYYVICANVPGSCWGSSGPPSTNPETDKPYGIDFPPVTIGDWTRAQRRLLDYLGIDSLHAVVGGSNGGINALDWAKRYPDDVQRVVPIAATPRADAQCLAFDTIARHAITGDPNWRGGEYYGHDHPKQGLMLARQLGHVRYLSIDSMQRKFGREVAQRDDCCPFPDNTTAAAFPYRSVESYLDYQGEKFADVFDANSYLYVTRATDEYDLADGYDSDADALAAFDGEALVLSFSGDWYFPVEDSSKIEDAFQDADSSVCHHVIESDYGHDAFLAEPERIASHLRGFLDDGTTGVPESTESRTEV